MTVYYKNIFVSLAILMALTLWFGLINNAQAQEVIAENSSTLDIPASAPTEETKNLTSAYPTMQMTIDKSELVKLDQDAASVVVGNPNHISVLLDTPDTLVVIPRMSGASHFSVIGKDGNIIMQRHVIVGAQKEKYVRIRRSCNAQKGECQEMSTFYCPDNCHQVMENSGNNRLR